MARTTAAPIGPSSQTQSPSLLPLPAGTHASEVTGISSDGQLRVGTISPDYSSRPQGKAVNERGLQFQGIV